MFFVIFSAIKSGSQMLELDVNLSKDNQVVVSHDEDLNRCTGNTGRIGDFDYKVSHSISSNFKLFYYLMQKFTHRICLRLRKQLKLLFISP